MRSTVALVGLLTLGIAFAGCLSTSQPVDQQGVLDAARSIAYDTSRSWSTPLSPALYSILDGVQHLVPSHDETPISMGLYLPDIAGCDWSASELPATCKLPVVMDSGPYWEDQIAVQHFRPPLVEWLVPRGYAVAYMSIRGTGDSGGCMGTFSMDEQKDVDAMVTWLATQAWSSGSVGMMGRSYDGTTPLMAATFGNPALKTIVPISSVTSARDLMFKNGTSELRGPIFHNVVYTATYGAGVGVGARPYRWDNIPEQVCDETVAGTLDPTSATLTGDASSEYFDIRDFKQRIAENYKGSVWIVHGLEDWNVNPSMVVPWIRDLQAAGIDTKAWLGVWGHAYPDRTDEHRNVRWDWADQTVRWFDFYLKGQGAKPALNVEVEDSLFTWRAEQTYPPADATMRAFQLGADGALAEGSGASGQFVLASQGAAAAAAAGSLGSLGMAGDRVDFTSEPLERDLRIAGLPQVHVTATPSTASSSYLFAELYDLFPDGRAVRIGWGAINLRFADGGNTQPTALTPGQPVVARMELEPVDAHVGRGHRLQLVLHRAGIEDILPSPAMDPVALELGAASVLRLPEVQRPTVLPTYTPPGLGGAP